MSTDAPTPPSMSRSRQIGLFAVVTLLVAVGQHWYGNRHHFYDLGIYHAAMQWWVSGHPLYDFVVPDILMRNLQFTYPPFAAILLGPLGWLSLPATIWVYSLVTIAIYLLTMWWLVRPLADRHGWPRWLAYGLAAVLATGLEPIREAFTLGQINFVLWLLVVLDLVVLAPRQSRLVGVGIGLATAIKLVPGIFIVYLLVTRRWRAAAVACATFGAATLLGFVVAPHDSWIYFSQKMLSGDGVGQIAYTFNQSIMGMLARLALPGHPNGLVWLLFIIPVLVYGVWRARRAAAVGDEYTGMALIGLVGSLISPLTWSHHIFWFVPALLVLADSALAPRDAAGPIIDGVRGHRGVVWFLILTYATVTYSVLTLWQFTLGQPGGVVGFIMSNWLIWVMLVLLVLLPIRRVRTLRPAPAAATQVAV